MKYHAIIVAGGAGSRMLSDLPKQFISLNGKPIIMHTIEAFFNSDCHPEITVVLNSAVHQFWEQLCIKYKFEVPHSLIAGGDNRFHSVKNGLDSIKDDFSIIAVHDAVRPFVSNNIITGSFKQAEIEGCAVTMIQSKDSIRRITSNSSEALNRDEIFLVQTPQTFTSKILREAYLQEFNSAFTDDASVVEKAGYQIHFFPGEPRNIKITYPDDLIIGEAFLKTHS
ncbi:MAG: 2-C-methyl-D-erythritol 4-phosphate cytidylyltransferase [Sphingobacteriales bacterium]|nr:2-C-methyl-D-erythritol 4-phosphate cytidylyltransferase [Sphingobacteriales bacterium]